MDKTLNFGIEIETVGLNKEHAARAIQSVVGGEAYPCGSDRWAVRVPDGRVWTAMPDGSLAGNENAEVVSPILGYADIPQLQEIVRALRHAGARADESCGIHIHVDGRRMDANQVVNLAKFVAKQEALMMHALGVSERRRTRYCRPVNELFRAEIARKKRAWTKDEVRTAWYGTSSPTVVTRYHESRYHGLNLNSYFYRGTIEFRYFNGTMHAGKIKAYIQFVLALASKAMVASKADGERRELNPATAKYDFRVVLLRLGLIGDEFETARLHLLAACAGSSVYKHGRPMPVAPVDAAAE